MSQTQTQTNQLNLETVQTKSIQEIRQEGIDTHTLERVEAERLEIQRKQQEMKARLPGQFLSLKQDKETRTFLFSGEFQRLQVPSKDFVTKQEIPGKTVTKWRFQVYDVTNPDMPSEAAIWERGSTEADQVLYWLSQGKAELTILRNGNAGSQKTTYSIFPAGR